MTASDGGILYLGAADVEAVALRPEAARNAVLAAFRAEADGEATTRPKLVLPVAPGRAFQSLCSAWPESGLAGNKWLGTANVPPGSGLPTVHSVVLLNDFGTGQLRAILDGGGITALRTAAMSAAAAQFMARPDARSIGFIGCGLQARFHLLALRALLPGLAELHAHSRTRRSAETLAASSGLPATVHEDPEAVVRASDVLVTSTTAGEGFQPFLHPDWVRPGAFVSSVDIGRPWLPDGLRRLDVLATDNHAQQAENPPVAPGLGPLGSYDADLAELASGTKPGRRTAVGRTMFIFRGYALADLAVAAAVLRAAEAAGIGQVLPR